MLPRWEPIHKMQFVRDASVQESILSCMFIVRMHRQFWVLDPIFLITLLQTRIKTMTWSEKKTN